MTLESGDRLAAASRTRQIQGRAASLVPEARVGPPAVDWEKLVMPAR